MAAGIVPHLANDQGVEKIFVGVKPQCMGCAPAVRPSLHLHRAWAPTRRRQRLLLDAFVYDARLAPDETDPKGVHRARPGGGRCRRACNSGGQAGGGER